MPRLSKKRFQSKRGSFAGDEDPTIAEKGAPGNPLVAVLQSSGTSPRPAITIQYCNRKGRGLLTVEDGVIKWERFDARAAAVVGSWQIGEE
jgi:hypothetical protein